MIKQLRLGQKVALGFVVLIALLTISSVVATQAIKALVHSSGELEFRGRTIKLSERMAINALELHLVGLMMMADREYGEVDKSDLDRFEAVKKRFSEDKNEFMTKMDNPQEKKAAEELISFISESININQKDVIPSVKKKDDERAFTGMQNQLEDAGIRSLKVLNEVLIPSLEKEMKEAEDAVRKTEKSITVVTTIAVVAVIFGIILSIFVFLNIRTIIGGLLLETNKLILAAKEGRLSTRAETEKINFEFRPIVKGMNDVLSYIDQPLTGASEVLQKVSKGDLLTEMSGDYLGDYAKIKESLNESVYSMRDALVQVRTTVDEVNSGSRQVADASQSLSQGATESAASLEEITSSMNEVGGQTKQNAEHATMAQTLSIEAKKSAEKGNEQMAAMIKAMHEINQSSQNISKIIKVIDEIAFQTNLLALNAAVEAARAGKHGKGFAVVAEEVRNLAARSAKAAKETTELIEDSAKKVNQGSQIATGTAKALEEIMGSSTKVTDLVSEIASASNEQAQGISQIVSALGQIDQVTQRNTALAEESAAASEELSGQAEQLTEMVDRFNLGVTKKSKGASKVKADQKVKEKVVVSRVEKPTSKPKEESWGGGPTEDGPKIVLDDSEFGKY